MKVSIAREGKQDILCKHQLSKISMQPFSIKLYLKGSSTMIDAVYYWDKTFFKINRLLQIIIRR